jgi:S1-C subfamily serine protease
VRYNEGMSTHPSALAALSSEITGLITAAAPFVVSVAARPHRPSSGIAIGGQLVLTADHAVERERDIVVAIDDRRYEAILAGRDPATDIAVLRVDGLDTGAPPVAAPPATGALVLSISRTGSGTLSAGLGVITSVGGPLRTGRGVVLPSIIRTDAAVRPGTAGGALVDSEGRIVGLTTPGLLRGLPVAIPATDAFELGRRLASRQPLGRGYLGVSVQPVALGRVQQDAGSDQRGLLVFGVAGDGAADRAGVLVGDILLRFDETPLHSPTDLQDQLSHAAPGGTAALRLLRGARVETLGIIVGERPAA